MDRIGRPTPLAPPSLGRYLSSDSSSSSGGSSPPRHEEDDDAEPQASPTTPPLELYRLMRQLSRASTGSASSGSGRRRPATASDGGSDTTGSVESNFVWIAVLRAKLEHTDEMAAFLKGVSARVLDNEPDVLSHRILRGVDDEDELLGTKFVVYAEFRDDDAFDQHIQSDEFQKLVGQSNLLAEPPQLYSYRDIPLSDAEGSDY